MLPVMVHHCLVRMASAFTAAVWCADDRAFIDDAPQAADSYLRHVLLDQQEIAQQWAAGVPPVPPYVNVTEEAAGQHALQPGVLVHSAPASNTGQAHHRKRGGRKKGSKNKKTLEREARLAAEREGICALQAIQAALPGRDTATTAPPATLPPIQKPPKAVPQDDLQTMELSLTVTVPGGDVEITDTYNAFKEFEQWVQHNTLAGYAGLERGPGVGHLHIQAVVRITHKDGRSVSASVRRAMRLSTRPVRYSVMTKLLDGTGIHTFAGMIGYCSKDYGKPHYDHICFQCTDEELECAKLEYAVYGAPVTTLKQTLNSASLFERVCHFDTLFPGDILRETFTGACTRMIRTGRYLFDARFVVPMNGFGMDPVKADCLWKVYKDPKNVQPHDIATILYQNPVNHRDRFPRICGETTQQYRYRATAEYEFQRRQQQWQVDDDNRARQQGRKRVPVGVQLYEQLPSNHCDSSVGTSGDDFVHVHRVDVPPEPRGKRVKGVGKGITVSDFGTRFAEDGGSTGTGRAEHDGQ